MIKIVSFKICPFVQRVTALLEAKNIPYELEYIQLNNKPQWFLDKVSTGQVPVLITENDQALFESDAIVEYLEEIYPPLEADITPEQRAMDRAWSYQASKHYLAQCSAMRSADRETLALRAAKLDKAFAKAEKQLADGPLFKGEKLSNVDIAWLPLLHRTNIIKAHTGYDFLEGYPKVQTWRTAVMGSGLAEKSVAADFEKTFTHFYLSEDTFLGKGESCDRSNSQCGQGECC